MAFMLEEDRGDQFLEPLSKKVVNDGPDRGFETLQVARVRRNFAALPASGMAIVDSKPLGQLAPSDSMRLTILLDEY